MGGLGRVYVIDDDCKVLESTAFLLSALGYEPTTFATAEEFLARAPELPFGCVLTDLRMPAVDGFELATRFSGLGLDWRVLMMTSDESAGLTERAVAHGIATVLPKPVRADDVADALAAAFGDRED